MFIVLNIFFKTFSPCGLCSDFLIKGHIRRHLTVTEGLLIM